AQPRIRKTPPDPEEGTMTKREIAKIIADANGLPANTVLEVVQSAFDGIIDTLVNEGRIELRNFGVFVVRVRRARKARNPKTGEAVEVPRHLVVAFKPGREMQQRIEKLVDAPGAVAAAAV